MGEIMVWIVAGLIIFNIILVVVLYFRTRNKFVPPVIVDIEPESVNGVTIGKYYGDPANGVCVEVISVEDNMVAFRYMKPSNKNTIMSMPQEGFLKKYYKYPNGCDFLTIGDQLET